MVTLHTKKVGKRGPVAMKVRNNRGEKRTERHSLLPRLETYYPSLFAEGNLDLVDGESDGYDSS